MFRTVDDLVLYVKTNYVDVSDARFDENHWDFPCAYCKVTRGFQVVKRIASGSRTNYSDFEIDAFAPITYLFRCPVCKAFKQWLVYELRKMKNSSLVTRYYRVTAVPNDGLEEITELPEQPPSLRTAYRQAIRAMDANANLAAAAMFRRALQIITRDLLGAKPGNLANELKEVVGKRYNGSLITTNFAEVAYVIKEAGNQGAHPDKDPDLLEFTSEDAEDLQQIFMELVSELFVVPAAREKAKSDFLARRKVNHPR